MTYRQPDHYSKKAKQAGYAARSVYKLEEIQKRWRVLAKGQKVLDLGCAPGSWSHYAREHVGQGGVIVGVDLQEVGSFPGTFLQGDIFEVEAEILRGHLGGQADVLLSDMAPSTTGSRFTDHVRQVELAQQALALSLDLVREGGAFLCKVFEGEDAQGFVDDVRRSYGSVKRLKPKATRDRSVEFFVVATNRKAP